MTTELPLGSPARGGRIVERPRLTRLLDETRARIILLTAPAGYGKTTLARQWLETMKTPAAWYRCTAASADIAALSAGLARAVGEIFPDAEAEVSVVLATDAPAAKQAGALEELLHTKMKGWPQDRWLVLDDYHVIQGTPADGSLSRLLDNTPLRLLIAARERPTWATARRIVYGEIFEAGLDHLAMTTDEVRNLLPDRPPEDIRSLHSLARGWPAVLGLAALIPAVDLASQLPASLYDYFAEELYGGLPKDFQRELLMLALPPVITLELANKLLDKNARTVVEVAARLGFFHLSQDHVELHPLLRSFLLMKLRTLAPGLVSPTVEAAVKVLVKDECWDDAFVLIQEFAVWNMLVLLVEQASPDLLAAGRTTTLSEWVRIARNHGYDSPALALAEAETAVREGSYRRAEYLAIRVARDLGITDPRTARAYIVSGRSAHLNDRFRYAHLYYRLAVRAATSTELSVAALWGQFLASHALGRPSCHKIAARLQEMPADIPEVVLRRAMTAFHADVLRGAGISSALSLFGEAEELASQVPDPMARSCFYQLYGHALMLNGRYGEAVEMARRVLVEAETYRLAFIRPCAKGLQAYAALGRRRFDQVEDLIADAEDEACRVNDMHTFINAQIVRARLSIARDQPEPMRLRGDVRVVSPLLRGEVLATDALVALALGDYDRASSLIREATQETASLEVATVAFGTRAALAISQERLAAVEIAEGALSHAWESGNLDGFVAAYRAYPLLVTTLQSSAREHELEAVVRLAADDAYLMIGSRSIADSESTLSKREREVLDLVAEGLSNKDIAMRLFISEATVKVHVRHIFEKLGVRTRTAAVARRLRQATSSKRDSSLSSARYN